MSKSTSARAFCAAVVLCSGCGSDDAETDGSQLSIGAQPVMATAAPVLDLTGTDGNGGIRFLSISGASRLSSGVIVVSDVFDNSVRFIDPSGEVFRVAGRAGEGPTEFGAPTWLGQCAPDTIHVWDSGQKNLAMLDSTGAFVRRSAISYSAASIDCTRMGTMLVSMTPSQISRPTAGVQPVYMSELWLADESAERTSVITEIPLGDPRPLWPLTRFALTDDRIYIGIAGSDSITVLDRSGSRVGSIALDIEPRRATREHQQSAVHDMVAPMAAPDYRNQVTVELMKLPIPDHLPLFTGLFTDPHGNLWVQLSAPGDSTTRFRVFDEHDTFVADVSLPENLTILEIGADFILAKYEDTTGELHLRMHELVWR